MNAWQWVLASWLTFCGMLGATLVGVALAGRHENRKRRERWNTDMRRALARYAAAQNIRRCRDQEFIDSVMATIAAIPETNEP